LRFEDILQRPRDGSSAFEVAVPESAAAAENLADEPLADQPRYALPERQAIEDERQQPFDGTRQLMPKSCISFTYSRHLKLKFALEKKL
jgi:hypothetical protein